MTVTTLAVWSTLLLGACTAEDSLRAMDDQAALDGADGQTDSAVGMIRLDRATPEEVAKAFTERRSDELRTCFEAYKATFDPAATALSEAVASKFMEIANASTDGACDDWSDLVEIVRNVLAFKNTLALESETLIRAMTPWAKQQLMGHAIHGYVTDKEAGVLASDVHRVWEANARARERDPEGIDLGAIRDQFPQVRMDVALDRTYLNPVTFSPNALDSDQVFVNLRAAFPLQGLELVSWGHAAVDDFARAHEGPDSDPSFVPISAAFHRSAIRKRFYFANTGESRSSNVLIVVDRYGQTYGLLMGDPMSFSE